MHGLFKSRFFLYLWYGWGEHRGWPPGFHFRLNFISCFHLSWWYILKAFRRLGAKKAGTTILVKSSMFAWQQTLVIPAAWDGAP